MNRKYQLYDKTIIKFTNWYKYCLVLNVIANLKTASRSLLLIYQLTNHRRAY